MAGRGGPYVVVPALAALAPYRHIVLVGGREPVAFFAYPGKPGRLAAPGTALTLLATPAHDPAQALEALAEAIGARRVAVPVVERSAAVPHETADALTPANLGELLAALIPEHAIVLDEAVCSGRGFDRATRAVAPQHWPLPLLHLSEPTRPV